MTMFGVLIAASVVISGDEVFVGEDNAKVGRSVARPAIVGLAISVGEGASETKTVFLVLFSHSRNLGANEGSETGKSHVTTDGTRRDSDTISVTQDGGDTTRGTILGEATSTKYSDSTSVGCSETTTSCDGALLGGDHLGLLLLELALAAGRVATATTRIVNLVPFRNDVADCSG